MPTTAAIYVRQSKDLDGEGLSVARQRAECTAHAYAHDLQVDPAHVYIENDTSAYAARPVFEQMLAAAGRGEFDRLIVWRVDRLYRRLADLVRITDALRDIPIDTVRSGAIDLSTADGRLHANLLGSVAQHEGEAKAERIVLRWNQRAAAGQALGSRRQFGWAWAVPCPADDTCQHVPEKCTTPGVRPAANVRGLGMVPHPVEAPLLAHAYEMLLSGATVRAICRWVAAQPGGRAMAPTPMTRLLRNPRNAGLVKHQGEVVAERADGAQIVDRETFDRAQAILSDPSRKMAPGRPTSTVLGGMLVCPCGAGRMTASMKDGVPMYQHSADGHTYRRRRDLLDEPILDVVGEVVRGLDLAGLLAPPAPATDPVEAKIAALELKRDRAREMWIEGDLPEADFRAVTKSVSARLATLEQERNRAAGRAAGLGGVLGWGAAVEAWRGNPQDAEGVRAALALLVDHVDVLPAAVFRKPAPSDVSIVWADWIPHRDMLPTAP